MKKRILPLVVCLVFSFSLCAAAYAKAGGGGSGAGGGAGSGQGAGKAGVQAGGAVSGQGAENNAESETSKKSDGKQVTTQSRQGDAAGKAARQKGVNPTVKVRGNELKFDVPPVIKEGRTLIPVRAIMNSLGAGVKWDAETKTVTITKGEQTIVLTLDSMAVQVNGQDQQIDYPARLISNRTFVPIRFIAETFGCKVAYDEESDTVTVEDGTGTAQPPAGTDSTTGSTAGSATGTGDSTTGATQTDTAQGGTDQTQTGAATTGTGTDTTTSGSTTSTTSP